MDESVKGNEPFRGGLGFRMTGGVDDASGEVAIRMERFERDAWRTIERWRLDTSDELVREGLISLGGVPPGE